MLDYTDATQIQRIYGVNNVNKWADLDNDEDSSKIAARIAWACEMSTNYMNGRLAQGKYEVPFTDEDHLPKLLVLLTSMLAGLMLFDGRLVVSSDPPYDSLARQRKDFRKYLRELLSGQIKLIDPYDDSIIDPSSLTVPSVASDIEYQSSLSAYDYCGCCFNRPCICLTLGQIIY